jgi:hypothetical protein
MFVGSFWPCIEGSFSQVRETANLGLAVATIGRHEGLPVSRVALS